ncbi:MAG TPA: glycosyltransferase family 4 protein [Chthoniobacteraceae bacterium]|nr:glycosyltransferase family 4 protein [Chthoniobacteraceae bacterium]
MRILLVSSSSGSRGGGELYLNYLGRALAERGHSPILWTSTHSRMDELVHAFEDFGSVERCDYLNTYDRRLRSLSAVIDTKTVGSVLRSWEHISPEVIHLNKQNLEDGLDLLGALTQISIPSLCTIHLTQSARYLKAVMAPVRDFVSRRALLKYNGPLVTVLENRRADLNAFIGESNQIRTIPNGVPIFDLSNRESVRAAARRKLEVDQGQLLVLAVGRLVPQKRPMKFLEHAAVILASHPNTKFLWVGDGDVAEEWDRYVSRNNLSHAVSRIGWQSDVTPFLFAADLFMHVAEFEGLPLAILEAMSAGLPCAISANLLSEMPFFDHESVIPIADNGSWTRALDDGRRLEAIGRTARAIAEEQFSYSAMAAQYEALYREAIAAKS